MKLNLWNVLSVFTLAATAGVGVLYLQIFVNPYAPINPFPPPTLPAALILPSATPTLRQLPPTWTYTPESGEKSLSLAPSSTPLPSSTPVNFPTSTETPTPTVTASTTPTRTKTHVHISTSTDTPEDNNEDSPTHTPKPHTTANATKTQAARLTQTKAAANARLTQTKAAANTSAAKTAAAMPANPSSVTETTQGLASNTCQKDFNNPAFSWTAIKGASGYYVSWSTDANATSTNTVPGNTFTPDAVSSSSRYYLRVRTVENSSWPKSSVFTFCYDTSAPTNPTDANISGVTSGEWTNKSNPTFELVGASDSVSDVAGYLVYFGTNSSGTPVNWLSGATYSPSFSLSTHKKYYLRVRAQDEAGNPAASAVKLFDYWYDGAAPTTPGNLDVADSTPSDNILRFSWTASADAGSGVANYELYFGTDAGATAANQTDTTGTTFASDTLTKDDTYILKVRAVDALGNKSGWASKEVVFTLAP